jgi:hypothetical protein
MSLTVPEAQTGLVGPAHRHLELSGYPFWRSCHETQFFSLDRTDCHRCGAVFGAQAADADKAPAEQTEKATPKKVKPHSHMTEKTGIGGGA